jgi:nicotinamidase-related amidase
MAEFPIVPGRTGMLFFDCLNIYLHPENPASQALVESLGLVPKMARVNEACRRAGVAIFYGQADHRPDGRDFAPHIVDRGYDGQPGEPPRRTVPPPVRGQTHGAEVIPEIAPRPEDYVIKKHRWSTFFQTHLELSLRTAGIETLIIAGGSTEVGIASTAYSARDLDINQIILRDACFSGKPGVNDFFMDHVFPVFARVMTTDELVSQLRAAA